MSKKNLMRELIGSHGESFGSTESGNAWCIKALHPSDPISECAGLPDESAVPSTHLSFMTSHAFQKPSSLPAGGTWGFDLDVLPHPVQFGALYTHDGGGASPETAAVLNSQLAGVDHAAKYTAFTGLAQRWRLTYCGVTLYQDGAALTNQGTIIACQRPVHAVDLYTTLGAFLADPALAATHACISTSGARAARIVQAYQDVDKIDFDSMTNMPNAYIGRSVDGCYMPLILTNTCQTWHGQHDSVMPGGAIMEGTEYGDGFVVPYSSSADVSKWPFYGLASIRDAGLAHVYTDMYGTSRMCSDIWGGIAGRNLDETTSFTVVFRYGFELQCQPGSIMSTQLRISPRYDPAALAAYFAIRRELKDAYPADFNDWAKIWKVIKDIGKMVLPGIGLMGPLGASIATGLQGVGGIVEHFTNRGSRPMEKGRNPLPLAQVERARKGVVTRVRQPASAKPIRVVRK